MTLFAERWRKTEAIATILTLLVSSVPVHADQILVIGDSWAEPIGVKLREVLDENGHPEIPVETTPYWGGPRNFDTPEGREAIEGWLEQWPEANYIYMQMGQNNWLCCWTTDMIGTQEETELFQSIVDHMANVVDHILSIRPGASLLWTAGEYFRPHHLGTPTELNANHDALADLAAVLAEEGYPEMTFLVWNGLFQVTYGFDGFKRSLYDPDYVIPPGDPSLPDPTLPSPYVAYPLQRPAHPTEAGYKVMAQALYDQYFDAEINGPDFQIDASLNGNWWNGLDRNGEGVQVEVSDGGDGTLTFVATIYSYDTMGNQIFLIAVGTVNGDTADVDVFITKGGVWGDEFDPALVSESQWGAGTFIASGCDAIHMALSPNAEFQSLDYTDLMYDLGRLTTPVMPCPMEGSN